MGIVLIGDHEMLSTTVSDGIFEQSCVSSSTKAAKLECFECHIQEHILFVTMISGPISVQTSSEILILAQYSTTGSLNHVQFSGLSQGKHFCEVSFSI